MQADPNIKAMCRICHIESHQPESATMRGTSRRVENCTYTVWRCRNCGTINALEEVDFEGIYQNYPMQMQRYDGFAKVIFAKRLKLLRRFGLKKGDSVLDYGCGSGHFVRYLNEKGYQCLGYDPHSTTHNNAAVLDRLFDLVTCQDVIEHVDDPYEMLRTLSNYVRPNGRLVLGTPYADNVRFRDMRNLVGILHQPFHRFLVSWNHVSTLCCLPGWTLEKVLDASYVDTFVPFANSAFLTRLWASGGGVLDFAFEPMKVTHFLRHPALLFWGFFGRFFPAHQTLFAVMRKNA